MMKHLTAAAMVAAMAVPAFAQSSDFDFLSDEGTPRRITLDDFEGGMQSLPGMQWSLGPAAGLVKAKDADKASWFGGVAGRLSFTDMFAGEASIVFRRDEFLDGDVTVTQYPVQLSGIFMPPLGTPGVNPYVLLGPGWYYTRSDYSGALSGTDAETDSVGGIHVGVGAQIPLGGKILGYADARYIFIDEPSVDNSNLEDEDWDSWEIALGVLFKM